MEKSTLMVIKNTRVHSEEIHSKVLGPTVGFMGKLPSISEEQRYFRGDFPIRDQKTSIHAPKSVKIPVFAVNLARKIGNFPNAKKRKSQKKAI